MRFGLSSSTSSSDHEQDFERIDDSQRPFCIEQYADEEDDDFDLASEDPSSRLLSDGHKQQPASIPLKKMYSTPTIKRSFSSKRISHRQSDSDDEDERRADVEAVGGAADEPGSSNLGPSTPSRLRGSRSFSRASLRASSFRSPGAPRTPSHRSIQEGASGAAHNGDGDGAATAAPAEADEEENEPKWLQSFDENRSASENKSLAISAELDAMGMGRYQVSSR